MPISPVTLTILRNSHAACHNCFVTDLTKTTSPTLNLINVCVAVLNVVVRAHTNGALRQSTLSFMVEPHKTLSHHSFDIRKAVIQRDSHVIGKQKALYSTRIGVNFIDKNLIY